MQNSLTRYDELNNIRTQYEEDLLSTQIENINDSDIIDAVLELLIMYYIAGCESAGNDLGIKPNPEETKFYEAVYRKTEGKDFEARIKEHIQAGKEGREALQGERVQEVSERSPIYPVIPVIDTESHRVFVDGEIDTAKAAGAKSKTWTTMLDDKVRDTHNYLEGMTVSINDRFFTYDGDSAIGPGGFSNAANNVNCRCHLKFSK